VTQFDRLLADMRNPEADKAIGEIAESMQARLEARREVAAIFGPLERAMQDELYLLAIDLQHNRQAMESVTIERRGND